MEGMIPRSLSVVRSIYDPAEVILGILNEPSMPATSANILRSGARRRVH
jgi:hypothetical protein